MKNIKRIKGRANTRDILQHTVCVYRQSRSMWDIVFRTRKDTAKVRKITIKRVTVERKRRNDKSTPMTNRWGRDGLQSSIQPSSKCITDKMLKPSNLKLINQHKKNNSSAQLAVALATLRYR